MKIATYDIAKNKTAPRGFFVCPYCGKIIERRLSKVKNTSLVFCDNECRAKHAERETLRKKFSVPNNVIELEIKRYSPLIRKLYAELCFNKNQDSFDSFLQMSRIAIWKAFNEANNKKGSVLSYYASAIRHSYYKLLRDEYRHGTDEPEILSLDDYSENYDRIASNQTDFNPLLEKLVSSLKEKKARSFKILCDIEIDGLTHQQAAKKYGISVRDISTNLYNAKKAMKKEISYEI